MSADVLGRAAALMRERAKAATEVWGVERWKAFHADQPYARGVHTPDLDRHTVNTDDEHGSILLSSSWDETQIVDHAASWHPAVALAVADLLQIVEAGYEECEAVGRGGSQMQIVSAWADNVARTYLGEA